MFSSTLFKKIFFIIFVSILSLSVCSYFLTVPFIRNKVYKLEEASAKTILDNVHEIVNVQYHDIEGYRDRALYAHKRELKRIIQIVEIFIRNRYQDYTNGLLSEEEAKKTVLEEIRSFRYGNNDYVWVANYSSVLISHPDNELNNADFSKVTDVHGNLIVPNLVKIAMEKSEGYYAYWWRRLGEEKHIEKLTYSKHFPEWKWVIGSGVYINDVEEEVQRQKSEMIRQLRQILRKIKIAGTGYMFIFDSDMNMLVHPDPGLEGHNASHLINPDTGKSIIREFIETSSQKNYIHYYRWDKTGDSENYIYNKLSWVKTFDKLGWYIASSVYVDELNNSSVILRKRIILISIITFSLFLVIASFLLYRLLIPVRKLSQAAGEVMDGNLSVTCSIDSPDEFGILAGAFNSMVAKLSLNIKKLDSRVKERTSELVKAKEEAETATRYKSEFLANMSHEIRTPLNAVIGLTHLTKETNLTMKQQDYMEKIENSAQSLLHIINDILDFSKIEAGKMVIVRTEFNLDEVLENISSLFGIKVEEKGLMLLFQVEDAIPKLLFGDSFHLTQILINLISNAIKFTDSGSVTLSVEKERKTIHQNSTDVSLKFSVSDTGIGLKDSDISKLFQPFTQIDGSVTRRYGGTGLGLSICKQLAGLMGGDIWVKSMPSKGSTFCFTSVFSIQDSDRTSIRTCPDHLRNMTILLITDNPLLRKSTAEILTSLSFRIFQASSGNEAFDILKQASSSPASYNLLILDQQMTGQSGIKILQRIRKNSLFRTIPSILLIAANEKEETLLMAKTMNIDGTICKPVIPSYLFDTVVSILEKGENKPLICSKKSEPVMGMDNIRGTRILLVEDNEINQQVASELLENRYCLVTVASNGKEAVEQVKNADMPYDIILMDIQMPVMNGLEAAEKILMMQDKARIPIIALTAHVLFEEKQKCFDVGMVDCISKPINPALLFSTLLKWIKPGIASLPEKKREAPHGLLPSALPGLDLACALEKVDYDERLYLSLLTKMRDSYGSIVSDIRKHLEIRDMDEVYTLIHAVKGVAGNLGANELYTIAVEMHQHIHRGDLDELETLLDPFEKKTCDVMSSIDKLTTVTMAVDE